MRRGTVIVALAAGVLASLLPYAPPVQAVPADPTCPSFTHDNLGWTWTPSADDADGVRAPVKLRTDGLLCVNTAHDAFNASWIGIQQEGGNMLAQIGVEHDFANGVGHWCRFWATGTGFPFHDYNCTDADDTQIYFKIEVTGTLNPVYSIYDCGTGGNFTQCSSGLKNSTQSAFTEGQAAASSEVNYSCVHSSDTPVIRMMGQGSDRVWYGNSSWNIDGKDTNGWAQRSWSFIAPFCTMDYNGATSTDGLRTWDGRNTS